MFNSIVSKLILFLGLISILISSISGFYFKTILIQTIIYVSMANNADCMLYGGCKIGAWSITIIPILGIILFSMNYFNILTNYIDYIRNFANYFKQLN